MHDSVTALKKQKTKQKNFLPPCKMQGEEVVWGYYK